MGEEPADAARRAAGSLVVLDGLLRLVSAGAGNRLGRVQAADSRSRPPSGYGRRPAAPRCDPGRLPRRAARRRPRLVERLDGGRRGVLPREARRAAHSRRRADGPGAGWVPADRRRRSGARSGAAVRGLGPGGRARHLPPAAASRARRRVRPGRPRARASRCGDRRTTSIARAVPRHQARRHSSTRCTGFPDGFGGVGLHHQGPVCLPLS